MAESAAKGVVVLDIGHSMVKGMATVRGRTQRVFFPSVVCHASHISDENEARRAALDTVDLPGKGSFFVGETALIQGKGLLTGLSESWITTAEHSALLLGAWQKITKEMSFDCPPDLWLGLPTSLHQAQKALLSDIAKGLLKEAVGSVNVVPQAAAPLYGIMLDANGLPSGKHKATESWGVIEIGYFSTDFMMTKRGRPHQASADICTGVSRVAEEVKKAMAARQVTMTLPEAEESVRTGRVKHFGKMIDISDVVETAARGLAAEVIDSAARLMESYIRQLDGVLIAGGGAPLVAVQIKERWPHAVVVEDARWAVAEGMRRMGMSQLVRALHQKSRG